MISMKSKVGHHMKSPEKREERRLAMLGDKNPSRRPEVRAKHKENMKGRPFPIEALKRAIIANRGNKYVEGRVIDVEERRMRSKSAPNKEECHLKTKTHGRRGNGKNR